MPSFAEPFAAGVPQSFVFAVSQRSVETPITVFYYKPRNATADSRVLFAVHGVERDAARARDNWIAAAEQHGVIVLAPQFDESRFPSRLFQMGGMAQPDPADWTFQVIESLFDKVRSDEGLAATQYDLFGHSAGGQFVHRHMIMMDRPRVRMAVAANAGSYTFAQYAESPDGPKFPWGLDEQHVSPQALQERFTRQLVVLLGEADVKTSGELPRSPQAMAQGATRLERGQNFCEAARRQALALQAELQWRCLTVPGVGHDSARMSRAAVEILFPGR